GGCDERGEGWGGSLWESGRVGGRRVKRQKPRRSADRPADQVRTGHQSQDRKGRGYYHSIDFARPRRRGDRMMKRRQFITLLGGLAARGGRAAVTADAARRRAPARRRERSGISGPRPGGHAGTGTIGLDPPPPPAD